MCVEGVLSKHGIWSCGPGGVYLGHISIIKNENIGNHGEGLPGAKCATSCSEVNGSNFTHSVAHHYEQPGGIRGTFSATCGSC